MDPTRRAELDRAYRATSYLAGPLRLRIGRRNAALDAMLAERGEETWAYLSAWNPGSEPVDDATNRVAHARLLAALQPRATLAGESRSDDGSWPPEASVLVLGIGREEAIRLGRAFGQAAILVGRRGQEAELVWLEDPAR
jgi:hypothetical protein